MAYDKEKIRKLVRMLESGHGEAGNAAGILTKMAKENGHNVDEMLAAVYGGSASSSKGETLGDRWARDAAAAERAQNWSHEDEWEKNIRESMRRAREKAKRTATEESNRRDRERAAREEYGRSFSSSGSAFIFGLKLSRLRAFWEQYRALPLSQWEKNFVEDILARRNIKTATQEQKLDEILQVYEDYSRGYATNRAPRNARKDETTYTTTVDPGKENGDEEKFWKA